MEESVSSDSSGPSPQDQRMHNSDLWCHVDMLNTESQWEVSFSLLISSLLSYPNLAYTFHNKVFKCVIFYIVSHLVCIHWCFPVWDEIRWVIYWLSCPWGLVSYVFITVLTLTKLVHTFDFLACRHVFVSFCAMEPSQPHTWAWLSLSLTRKDRSPEGEAWVWAPSSWQ